MLRLFRVRAAETYLETCLDIWYDTFARYPLNQLAPGIQKLIASTKRMPVPADLMAAIHEANAELHAEGKDIQMRPDPRCQDCQGIGWREENPDNLPPEYLTAQPTARKCTCWALRPPYRGPEWVEVAATDPGDHTRKVTARRFMDGTLGFRYMDCPEGREFKKFFDEVVAGTAFTGPKGKKPPQSS
jgi:hypothetical protein